MDRSDVRAISNRGIEFLEERSLLTTTLLISEINYNPYDPVPEFGDSDEDNDKYEFLEILNYGEETVDLTGVQLVRLAVDGNREGSRLYVLRKFGGW